MVLICVRVDVNARPKVKVVTDDEQIAKLCHMHGDTLSMVLIHLNIEFYARFSFVLGVEVNTNSTNS